MLLTTRIKCFQAAKHSAELLQGLRSKPRFFLHFLCPVFFRESRPIWPDQKCECIFFIYSTWEGQTTRQQSVPHSELPLAHTSVPSLAPPGIWRINPPLLIINAQLHMSERAMGSEDKVYNLLKHIIYSVLTESRMLPHRSQAHCTAY